MKGKTPSLSPEDWERSKKWERKPTRNITVPPSDSRAGRRCADYFGGLYRAEDASLGPCLCWGQHNAEPVRGVRCGLWEWSEIKWVVSAVLEIFEMGQFLPWGGTYCNRQKRDLRLRDPSKYASMTLGLFCLGKCSCFSSKLYPYNSLIRQRFSWYTDNTLSLSPKRERKSRLGVLSFHHKWAFEYFPFFFKVQFLCFLLVNEISHRHGFLKVIYSFA